MMQEILVQVVVLLLVAVMAAVKSLRFTPSKLTDFELQRQVKQGRESAIAEDRLRRDQPLLLALQQLAILLLVVVIIVCLRSAYSFFGAILFACLWLLLVEVLCARRTFRSFIEEMADRHQLKLLPIVDRLRPGLRFIADVDSNPTQQATFYSKDELMYALEHDHGVLTKEEVALIRRAIQYSETSIKHIMIKRSSIVAVEHDETIGPVLLDRLHKSGQAAFPVIKRDIDHIIGTIALRDIVSPKKTIKSVADCVNGPVIYLQEGKTLDHALQAFLHTEQHLFIVVNESEKTTGVISIESILEWIIGRTLADEFDRYEDLRSVAKLATTVRQKSSSSRLES